MDRTRCQRLAALSLLTTFTISGGCSQTATDTAISGETTRSSETAPQQTGEAGAATMTAKEVQQETQEALDAARKYTALKVDDYRAEMEQRLATLQNRLQALHENASKATSKLKPELTRQLAKMEEEIERLRDELREKHGKTAAAWDALKSGVDAAITELETTASRVKQQLTAPAAATESNGTQPPADSEPSS